MDKFKNRIKYYMLGLGFGVLAVYFMFGNRGCAWLPENRAKNMIGEKEIIVGDSVLAVMQCFDIDNDDIYALLKNQGEVEFSKSKTSGIKEYHIEAYKGEVLYWARFALYEERDLAEVIEVHLENEPACVVNISNNDKSTVPLPHEDVIAILESHEFRILERAECQMDFYGIEESDLFNFHKNAIIDIYQSEPRLSPNPFYVMKGELNNKPFSVKYIVGENRTRINSIVGEQKSDCQNEL